MFLKKRMNCWTASGCLFPKILCSKNPIEIQHFRKKCFSVPFIHLPGHTKNDALEMYPLWNMTIFVGIHLWIFFWGVLFNELGVLLASCSPPNWLKAAWKTGSRSSKTKPGSGTRWWWWMVNHREGSRKSAQKRANMKMIWLIFWGDDRRFSKESHRVISDHDFFVYIP